MTGSEAAETAPTPLAPKDRAGGAAVLVSGALVIALLTWYNRAGVSVYRYGQFRGGRSFDEYLVVNIAGILLPPMLVAFGMLRGEGGGFGIRAAERGTGRIAWLMFAAMAPVLWLASRFPVFYTHYPLQPAAAESWGNLLAHELTYGVYLLCWEWFYRGYLTFGLIRLMDARWAVAVQAVGFGIMHIGKPAPEVIGSFAGGVVLGWLALRARSFLPGFALHWGISAAFDLLCLQARPGRLF